MSSKVRVMNYITLLLAIISVAWGIYASYFDTNKIYPILLLVLTIFMYFLNKEMMEQELRIKKEDKEIFKQIVEEKKVKKRK